MDNSSRDTLASRRPNFDPSLVNNSILDRSSSLSSPFYNGNTMFGGANAANLYANSSNKSLVSNEHSRTSVQVNSPTSKNDLMGLSTTARRILDTLEQFSSPLTDARKIPIRDVMGGNPNSSKRQRQTDEVSPRVGLRHLTRELVVPTVPDILRIRRRQKLYNTTMNARKIANASGANTSTPRPKYHLRYVYKIICQNFNKKKITQWFN